MIIYTSANLKTNTLFNHKKISFMKTSGEESKNANVAHENIILLKKMLVKGYIEESLFNRKNTCSRFTECCLLTYRNNRLRDYKNRVKKQRKYSKYHLTIIK